MPSYRLLRSNKESGPYSFNDLLTLGLKPYDLVWVEGRSAAWRYPSEVAELKEYAPVIEEQPFDRFFKKPSASEAPIKESNPSTNQNHPLQEPKYPINPSPSPERTINENFVEQDAVPVKTSEPVKKQEPEPEVSAPSYKPNASQPKKKVFVALPETNAFDPFIASKATESFKEEQYHQYLPKPRQAQPEEKSYSPINIRESEESKLETKYTQSLDDIKEMYVNTLVQRKTKNKRKEIARKLIKPVVLPLSLVVVGIAIGYFITNKKVAVEGTATVAKVIPQQTSPEQKQPVVAPEQKSEDPIDQNGLQPDEKQNLVSLTDNKKANVPAKEEEKMKTQKTSQQKIDEKKPSETLDNGKTATTRKTSDQRVRDKETVTSSNETSLVQKKDLEVDPATGERKSVTRSNSDLTSLDNNNSNNTSAERSNKGNVAEHKFLDSEPKNLLNLVSVKSNNYVRGAFGGIRGLELTVSNNSSYLLDEVSVEVQIMKPSEQPLRTDIITFKNISANGAVTVKVPDSQRGIRVDYRITNIESKQFQKGTAGL